MPDSRQIPADVAQEIADHLYAGRKIQAIKLYRNRTGQGLKEAKEFIESLEAELRAREPARFARGQGKGCAVALALLTLTAAALVQTVRYFP